MRKVGVRVANTTTINVSDAVAKKASRGAGGAQQGDASARQDDAGHQHRDGTCTNLLQERGERHDADRRREGRRDGNGPRKHLRRHEGIVSSEEQEQDGTSSQPDPQLRHQISALAFMKTSAEPGSEGLEVHGARRICDGCAISARRATPVGLSARNRYPGTKLRLWGAENPREKQRVKAGGSVSQEINRLGGSRGFQLGQMLTDTVGQGARRIRDAVPQPIVRGGASSEVAVYRPAAGDAGGLGTASKITAEQPLRFELDEFGAELFPVARIENGYAVFGLVDRVLSPATVKDQQYDAGNLTVTLNEPGTFAMWAERRPKAVLVDGRPTGFEFKNNLLTVDAGTATADSAPVQIQVRL